MQQIIKKDDVQALANKIKNRLDLDTITPSEMPEKIALIGGSDGSTPSGSYYNETLENPYFMSVNSTDYLIFDPTGVYILKNKTTLVLLEAIDMTGITPLVTTSTYVLFASNRGVFLYDIVNYTFKTKLLGDFSAGLTKYNASEHYVFISSALSVTFYFNSNNQDCIIINATVSILTITKTFSNGNVILTGGISTWNTMLFYNIIDHTVTVLNLSKYVEINASTRDYYLIFGSAGFYIVSDDYTAINRCGTDTASTNYSWVYKYIESINKIIFDPSTTTYCYVFDLNQNTITKSTSSYPTSRSTANRAALGITIYYGSSTSYPGLYYLNPNTAAWTLFSDSTLYLGSFTAFNINDTTALITSTSASYPGIYRLTYINGILSMEKINDYGYNICSRTVSNMSGNNDYNGLYGISLGNNKYFIRCNTTETSPASMTSIYNDSTKTFIKFSDLRTNITYNLTTYAHLESNILFLNNISSSYPGLAVYNLDTDTYTEVTTTGYYLTYACNSTSNSAIKKVGTNSYRLLYNYFGCGKYNSDTNTYTEYQAPNLNTYRIINDNYILLYTSASSTSGYIKSVNVSTDVVTTYGTTLNTYDLANIIIISDYEIVCISGNSSYRYICYYNLSTGTRLQYTSTTIIYFTTSYCNCIKIDNTHFWLSLGYNSSYTAPSYQYIFTIGDTLTASYSNIAYPVYSQTTSTTTISYCNHTAFTTIKELGSNYKILQNRHYIYLYNCVNNTIDYMGVDNTDKLFEEVYEDANYYIYRFSNNYPSRLANTLQGYDYLSMIFVYNKQTGVNSLIGYGQYLKMSHGILTFNTSINNKYTTEPNASYYGTTYRPMQYFNLNTGLLSTINAYYSASTNYTNLITGLSPTCYNKFDTNKVMFYIFYTTIGSSHYKRNLYAYFNEDSVGSSTNYVMPVGEAPTVLEYDNISTNYSKYNPVLIEKHLSDNYILLANQFETDKIIKFDLSTNTFSNYKIGVDG